MHRDQPGPRPSARPCVRRALVPAVLGLAALLPTTAAVAAAPPQGEIRSTVAAPVDYRLAPAASGAASSARAAVAPAATSVPGVPGPAQSRWQVSYTGFSPEARAAFERAVAIWAGTVRSPVPITVSATMRDLGDRRLLGRTSPSVHVGGELGDGGTAYAGALADALIGEDIAPDLVDIATTLNLVPENAYYFGTDGRPGPGQVDFTTVVLHELGHGLGLSSSLRVDAATGLGTYGDPGDPTP